MKQAGDNRPNPDELLASLVKDEEKSRRGKLKIFFGMCAGVGKTYSMLKAAQVEKNKGIDIIIGYVETHNRKETDELVEGFELIQRKSVIYKSASIQEMDLDAILERKPVTVLVDELAHSNAPGSRHLKRYKDVIELLENGINVYSTLNVQHLESRSETVAQITGVKIQETIPDEIFENSEEVELIDLTPDELIQRFNEGKVYTPERSKEAIDNFFRKGNITALREMALRIVADRVDNQLKDYMHDKRIQGPWKSGIRLLVAIDHRQHSTQLLRWAKNLSYSMGGQIEALYVETGNSLNPENEQQLNSNIRLAKQLGIKVSTNANNDIVKAIIEYAQRENITHIVVGKPRVRNLASMIRFGNFFNRLIRYSGNIDVYILGADRDSKDKNRNRLPFTSFSSGFSQYVLIVLFVSVASVVCYGIKDYIGNQAVSFVLLFLVSILAIFYGTGPVFIAALMSAVIWDFFFLPPQFTLHIEKPEDILMFLMFFTIALLNGVLTSKIRSQEIRTRIREENTNALYQLTKDLSRFTGTDEVTKTASSYIKKYFKLDCILILKNEFSNIATELRKVSLADLDENEISVANWVFSHSEKAGKHTDTLPSCEYTYYPLKSDSGNMGVVAIRQKFVFSHAEEQFWESFLSQISSKYEREFLREAARHTFMISESEKLYRTIFNSISHELRIPVATIVGASDTLLDQEYSDNIRKKLYSEINTASIRLNRLIENLLNMSRLESGMITLNPDWCDIHDLSNSVIESLKEELKPFILSVIIPSNMPLVRIDFGLIEQVLHNLLLNATQYAPQGTQIRIKFFSDGGALIIQVMDRGKGFNNKEIESVFNKFFRGKDAKSGGTGLGLSIVKGFVEAHNGTVTAENRKNGGALFTVKIPVLTSNPSEIKINE